MFHDGADPQRFLPKASFAEKANCRLVAPSPPVVRSMQDGLVPACVVPVVLDRAIRVRLHQAVRIELCVLEMELQAQTAAVFFIQIPRVCVAFPFDFLVLAVGGNPDAVVSFKTFNGLSVWCD